MRDYFKYAFVNWIRLQATHSALSSRSGPSGAGVCADVQLDSTQPPVVLSCISGRISRLAYNTNEAMSAIISSQVKVTLTFTTFNTEQGWDKVTVKSCTNTSCSSSKVLLNGYSGSSVPSPVTSKTGVMLIQWSSDSAVNGPGWSATWNSSGEHRRNSFCYAKQIEQWLNL
jgi:hypothetical protein